MSPTSSLQPNDSWANQSSRAKIKCRPTDTIVSLFQCKAALCWCGLQRWSLHLSLQPKAEHDGWLFLLAGELGICMWYTSDWLIPKQRVAKTFSTALFSLASHCSRKFEADRKGSGRAEEVGHQLSLCHFREARWTELEQSSRTVLVQLVSLWNVTLTFTCPEHVVTLKAATA